VAVVRGVAGCVVGWVGVGGCWFVGCCWWGGGGGGGGLYRVGDSALQQDVCSSGLLRGRV